MGKYSNSNFGDISGKVGNAIGSNWRGIKYMRSLSAKRAKGSSPLQLAQYAKFALSASMLSPIKDVLSIGFSDRKLSKITGYNAAVRAFLTDAVTGTYPNYAVDYSKIKMSKGSLDQPLVAVEAVTGIALSWSGEIDGVRSQLDDTMYFVIYNQTKDSYKLNNSSKRVDVAVAIPFPGVASDVLHVWSFCVSRDGKSVSKSQYVGSVTVPV